MFSLPSLQKHHRMVSGTSTTSSMPELIPIHITRKIYVSARGESPTAHGQTLLDLDGMPIRSQTALERETPRWGDKNRANEESSDTAPLDDDELHDSKCEIDTEEGLYLHSMAMKAKMQLEIHSIRIIAPIA
jgi:hypothetical protein